MNEGFYHEFYTSPPDYASLRRALYQLKGRYDRLRVFPIGQSLYGREIFALALGDPRGATLYVGGTHGLEWLTTLLLCRFAEELLGLWEGGGSLAQIDVTRALEGRSLVIIPTLNPDGAEIAIKGWAGCPEIPPEITALSRDPTHHWQANGRGIDLNHNFDAGFSEVKALEREAGFLAPGPTRYGGERPHSEPESAAITAFCKEFTPRQLYAFHSQGEEIYYRYGPHTPPRSQLMAQVLASTCGYRVCTPTGTASHGGLKDWFIETFDRPGFTVEIGKGRNPLPVAELEKVYRQLREMLMLGIIL